MNMQITTTLYAQQGILFYIQTKKNIMLKKERKKGNKRGRRVPQGGGKPKEGGGEAANKSNDLAQTAN